jgi:hypothetical protein
MNASAAQGDLTETLREFVQQGKMAQDLAKRVTRWTSPEQQVAYLRRYKDERVRMLDRLDAEFQPSVQTAPTLMAKINGILVAAGVLAGLVWALHSAFNGVVNLVQEWKMPTPVISQAYMTPDHRVILRWAPLGSQYGYRIYYSYTFGRDISLSGDSMLDTPGATINLAANGHKEAYVSVKTVTLDGRLESWASSPIRVNLNQFYNSTFSIEPAP